MHNHTSNLHASMYSFTCVYVLERRISQKGNRSEKDSLSSAYNPALHAIPGRVLNLDGHGY